LEKYGITPWYDDTGVNESEPSLSNGEIITKIELLKELKFFQSKEIKFLLEGLSAGTSGALQQKIQVLLRTYRSRNEILFHKEVAQLRDALSNSKEV
jgi:hypothetical protein